MMSDHDSFRPDLRHRAKTAFDAAGRSERSQTAREGMSVTGVERRAAQIRSKVRAHQQKMTPQWVKAEAEKLRREDPLKPRQGLADGPRSPSLGPSRRFARQQSIAARAEANVRKRCAERLRTIESVERRMVRNLTRHRKQRR